MSKTQLQTNNARLAALITELEGKAAGGGGGVETCTVVLNYPVRMLTIYATIYENGVQEARYISLQSATINTMTIENVLCNSFMLVSSDRIYTPMATITGGGDFMSLANTQYQGYSTTNVSGGTMTVSMYDDD